jgi:hypothetical protein
MDDTAGADDDSDDPTGAFLVAIFDDVRRAERELHKDDSSFMRRAYVRATFSSVEGFAFTLKKIALGKPELFTSAELAILREEDYQLTASGDVRVGRRFPRTAENLRFAFAAFMRFHGTASALPKDEGWDAFVAAVEVRNRITHPKRVEDLELSDRDVTTVRHAAHWVALNVLISVVQTMGRGVMALILIFLIGWGIMKETPTPEAQLPETD